MTAPAACAADVEHLYVHVPFCARKCGYCDFNSHAGRDAEIDVYLAALEHEARERAQGAAPRTIFVGGGTPTHPSADAIGRYLSAVRGVIDVSRLDEFTVEANPGTLTADKIAAMRDAGVDRVSIGVQSFHDRHLETLGRIHDGASAARAVEAARDGGIRRVSLDLILAIPGQTLGEQREDLDRAVALAPDHVSAYVLTYEEGTAFRALWARGRLPGPDDDRDHAHLALACERLADAGYERYEISNHARPGEECRHNLGYWQNRSWLGLGAGAHSHADGRRWKNRDDPGAYARAVMAGGEAVEWVEEIDATTAVFETLMMGLRLTAGVDLDAVTARTGVDPRVLHRDAMSKNVADGLLCLDGSRLRLTARGFDLASYVLRSFLP